MLAERLEAIRQGDSPPVKPISSVPRPSRSISSRYRVTSATDR
jgi:hypothetical protein